MIDTYKELQVLGVRLVLLRGHHSHYAAKVTAAGDKAEAAGKDRATAEYKARKAPVQANWNKRLPPTLDEIEAHTAFKGWIGWQADSIGLTIVDVDTGGKEAVEAVIAILGAPVVVYSTPNGFHLGFKALEKPGRLWSLPEGRGEFLNSGHQAVLWRPEELLEQLHLNLADAEPADLTLIKRRGRKGQKAKVVEPTPPENKGASTWVQDQIVEAVERILGAAHGTRNFVINDEAFRAGTLSQHLSEDEQDMVIQRVASAAVEIGDYPDKDKELAMRAFRDGFNGYAANKPREVRDAENAAKADAVLPDMEWGSQCPMPDLLHVKPVMPPCPERSVDCGEKPDDEKWLTNHELLAGQMVLDGAAKRFMYVRGDKRWYAWASGFGWYYDEGEARVLRAATKMGTARFAKPNREEVLKLDPSAGGRMPLARATVASLPAFAGMSVEANDLDLNPNLIGLPKGRVYDLSTGRTRDAVPEDRVTVVVPFEPAPVKGSFMEKFWSFAMRDADTAEALHRLLGQTLWGEPMSKGILFMPGRTGTGKSGFVKLLNAALGPYARVLKSDMLTTRASGQFDFASDNANAALRGIRLALMSEIPKNRRLDPARINELTGGDDLVGRRIQADQVTTKASHSIAFMMNDRPAIDAKAAPDTVEALFVRLRMGRFHHVVSPAMGSELNQRAVKDPRELGAVLQWLMDGAEKFRLNGEAPLSDPMKAEVDDYWTETEENDL